VLHREHSMLVTVGAGPAVLLVAFEGDSPAVLLREIEPGLFAEEQASPYREGQMGIRIASRTDGSLRHAYCWADAEGEFLEVDIAELRLP
jgi:hypothetical protein